MEQWYCVICGNEIPKDRLHKHKTTCCKSCAGKLRFKNPEERKKLSLVMKQTMTKEVRQKISHTLKNQNYLSEQQERQKKLSKNKSIQKKKSTALKKYWKTADREAHSNKIKLGQILSNAYEKISLASKNNWQNDEYRQKVIQRIKQSWIAKKALNIKMKNNKRSDMMKKLWQDEDFKKKQKLAIAKSWSDEVKRQQQSEKIKQIRSDKSISGKTSIGLKKYFSNQENRAKQSITLKKIYENPEVRHRVSAAVSKALSNPDIKAKQKAGLSKALSKPEVQAKINSTKKKNQSFNSSKIESYVEKQLLLVFDQVNKQYRSNVYPYNCDFYIPLLDLYIECNFHWTHGKQPFNENNEFCIEQLNKWKEKAKSSKFYQNAINTWVVRDTNKRICATKNNLNWLCFYTIEEFKQWLNSLNDAIAIKCTQIKPD